MSAIIPAFFLTLTCASLGNGHQAAEGTSFITAFPQLRLDQNMSSSIWFMTQGSDNVSVRVQSLSISSSPLDVQVTVSPGQAVPFYISSLFEQPLGNVLTNDGVRITAPSPIFADVYLRANIGHGDIHPLIPDPLLGTEYFAAAYSRSDTLTASFILVVAQVDNTDVSLELSKLADGETIQIGDVTYDRRDTLLVTLNSLQTLQIQTASDLTGTRISSTKPVATYSGQNRTRVVNSNKCFSHLSDQLPPVVNLGRRFVLLSTPEKDVGDLYRFIAAHPFTTVVVESVPKTTIHLLSPGDFYEYDLASQSYLYAQSDRPVMVVQLTKTTRSTDSLGDPSMGVLAPLEQAESFYLFPKTLKWEYVYMTFVIQSPKKDGLRLNNQPLSSHGLTWNTVPGTDMVAGYVKQFNGESTPMKMHHVNDEVFNVHASTARMCESKTMPLTYGKPLPPTSSPRPDETTPCVVISETAAGDGVDNDCDGRVDEENCDPGSGMNDDDGDGFVNEDCAASLTSLRTIRSSIFTTKLSTKVRAEIVQKRSVEGPVGCVLICMQQTRCWAVNLSTSTSDLNCELLSGLRLGMQPVTGWQSYERQRITM